jgi:hypothetical protein
MKNIIVSKIWLEIIKRQLGETLLDVPVQSTAWQKLEGLEHKLRMVITASPICPSEFCPGITKQDLVHELGLENIDYGLPQNMVDSVMESLGYNMVPDFVYQYGEVNGPVPITTVGRAMLPVINKVVFGVVK